MNTPQAKSRHSNGSTPTACVVLPDELIAEILSFLTVKSLMRLRCVSKSWNSLVFDPSFVKMHLNRSSRNSHIALVWCESDYGTDCSIVPLSLSRLLEEPLITFVDDAYYQLKDKDCFQVVGCCNGLICLHGYSSLTPKYRENWLYFWNPATRSMSKKLGSFGHDHKRRRFSPDPSNLKFTFGYDNLTDTYKVVAWTLRNEVRVFSLGDNVWKNIQSFPVVPFDQTSYFPRTLPGMNHGVYLNGTINWLAIRNNSGYDWETIIFIAEQCSHDGENITAEQFVIISLDLGTETYRQLLLPRGFDEVPYLEPTVVVLMDCLCFSHDFQETHFVIWQMKEFGVEKSWTQLFKISYQTLQPGYEIGDLENLLSVYPLCLFENSDTLILASDPEDQAILYNWRDSSVKRTTFTNEMWWFFANDYVESLVSTG